MKFYLFIFLISCSTAFGQTNREWNIIKQRGDSLEQKFADQNGLFSITDTIPVIITEDDDAWKKMKCLTYFYDSTKELKKIVYRNGLEGNCSYYLDGKILRKVTFDGIAKSYKQYYYFSDFQNGLTNREIQQKQKEPTEFKENYELLNSFRNFQTKFANLVLLL
jgi:hypothetical protein